MFKVKLKNLRKPIPLDDYWMGMAFWIAAKSECPEQEGAIIVQDSNVLFYGYDTTPLPGSEFFQYAEQIALKNNFVDATMYITRTPNSHTLLEMTTKDLSRVIYFHDKDFDRNSQDIINQSNIKIEPYAGNLNWMRDYILSLQDIGLFN